MKKYSSYKPSGVEWIGDIPFEWSIIRLKWITEIENSYDGGWRELNTRIKGILETDNKTVKNFFNYHKFTCALALSMHSIFGYFLLPDPHV